MQDSALAKAIHEKHVTNWQSDCIQTKDAD